MPQKIDKLVPDTSVIIEGLVSDRIEKNEIKVDEVIIHEAVLAELEHQSNLGKAVGFIGLDELKKLRELSKKKNFEIKYIGKRPSHYEIKFAKLGEIDADIRQLAWDEGATLLTGDKVQARAAEAKGISVIYIEKVREVTPLSLEKFFDPTTMSVHLRENVFPYAKKGIPGKWEFIAVEDQLLKQERIKEISKEIIEEARLRHDGFIEMEREGSTIVQLGKFRIVITKPPFSDGWEITAVRPVRKLTLDDYHLSEKLRKRVEQAEGILIAGAPGHGKTTFAQALAEFYAKKEKIVKTVEAPRDLDLPENITQYAISHGTPEEIHDILLLCRPDYTIFDEMRNTPDFKLFADLRLAGVGMVGVIHATAPIDAIQRFIGRVELGVIPHIIDTVIFIKNGAINKVFSIKMEVKVPSGMTEADLARPIVTVTDFETGKLECEIYTYGEETVVIPVKLHKASPAQELAKKEVEKEFRKYADNIKVDFVSDSKCIVYVPEMVISRIIGKQGANIEATEKKLGVSIDVREISEAKKETSKGQKESLPYEVSINKNNITFILSPENQNRDVDIIVSGDYLLTARVGKKGIVRIRKDNKIGKIIINALNSGEEVILETL